MATVKQAFAAAFVETSRQQRKLALQVWSAVSRATPKDTGRAQASWRVSLATDIDASVEPAGKGKGEYERTRPNPGLAPLGVDMVVSNNLPYIVRLNEGYSEQAPSFFVEQAVADVLRRNENAGG